MKDRKNRVTREVYIRVLEDLDDPRAAAMGWLDVGAGSAVAMLARRIRKDLWAEFGNLRCSDFLAEELFRCGLRQVDWKQVAERLLAGAMPNEDDDEDEVEATEEDNDADGGIKV